MLKLTSFERQMLPLEVRSLQLPALEAPSDIDLWERAHAIDYGYDDSFVRRGDENLTSWLMILGVVPSTVAERLRRIVLRKERYRRG